MPVADATGVPPHHHRLIAEMRRWQDLMVRADLTVVEGDDLASRLAELSDWLEARQYDEGFREHWGDPALPAPAQGMVPEYEVEELHASGITASVRFGRWFSSYWSVHGGAIPLIFDEVLGTLANWNHPIARTAHLVLDYRAPTPVGEDLVLTAITDGWQGRKLWVDAVLRRPDGMVLVEARALFVTPREALAGATGGEPALVSRDNGPGGCSG